MKKETKKAAKARLIAEKIAAKEAAKEARRAAVFSTPVAIAVEPLRVDAMREAKEDKEKEIQAVWDKMDTGGNAFDINAVAPEPEWSLRRTDKKKYEDMQQWNSEVREITRKTDPEKYYSTERIICEDAISHLVLREQQMAAHQYEAFVYKLVAKIGETVDASLMPHNGLWENSVLVVRLPSGEVQNWKTTRIINRSCLGKLFFQWPTRLMKGGE